MGTGAHVKFVFNDDVEAFSFTTDNLGYPDCVGQVIAKTISDTDIRHFLKLSTNVLAEVSRYLPKRTAVVPSYTKDTPNYLDGISYFYTVAATSSYENSKYHVSEVINIEIMYDNKVIFSGDSESLKEFNKKGE